MQEEGSKTYDPSSICAVAQIWAYPVAENIGEKCLSYFIQKAKDLDIALKIEGEINQILQEGSDLISFLRRTIVGLFGFHFDTVSDIRILDLCIRAIRQYEKENSISIINGKEELLPYQEKIKTDRNKTRKEVISGIVVDLAKEPGRKRAMAHHAEYDGKDLSLTKLNEIEEEHKITGNMTYSQRNAYQNKLIDSTVEPISEQSSSNIVLKNTTKKGPPNPKLDQPPKTSFDESDIMKIMQEASKANQTQASASLLREQNESRRLENESRRLELEFAKINNNNNQQHN